MFILRNALIRNPPPPGLGLGGAWGFVEGFRRPIAAARQAPAVAPAAAAAAGTATGAAPTAQAIGAQATAFAKEAASAAAASTTEGAAAAAARPAAGAAAAQRVSARLRWNNVLNQVTRRGTSMGNSAGVLGEAHPHLFRLLPFMHWRVRFSRLTLHAILRSSDLQRYQLDDRRLPRPRPRHVRLDGSGGPHRSHLAVNGYVSFPSHSFPFDARCGSCARAPPLLQGDDILTRFLSSLSSPRERSWHQVDGRHFQSAHRRRRRLVLVQGSTSLIGRHHIRSRRIVCFRPVTFSLPPVSLVYGQAGACNNKETCTQRKPATLRNCLFLSLRTGRSRTTLAFLVNC